MAVKKLPSNSEKVLLELVRAENPTKALYDKYSACTANGEEELDGIVRELSAHGFIQTKWADNMPYKVILNNSARTYEEEIAGRNKQKAEELLKYSKMKDTIFISHRSTDKEIADMLVDFFSGTGIAKEKVFCSSLPGNDIQKKISDEVKSALKSSAINIAILSKDYYQSAYCLNEAGVLWYDDTPVIPIALPEINPNNMYGFLNSEYKLRRLDSDTDVAYIYDAISEAVSAPHTKASIITSENNKLRKKYEELRNSRIITTPVLELSNTINLSELTTDDERIVLYYILKKNVRKITKSDITEWLIYNEIHNVNIDNAFDLLSSFEDGVISNDTLELGIKSFREYSSNAVSILPLLKKYVNQHTRLASDSFNSIWESNTLTSTEKLFIAYIVDERIVSLGTRWETDTQIKDIEQWENKNSLEPTLSSNYSSCLELFIQKKLVYESAWTSHGNPRKYSLYSSLYDLLFNCPTEIKVELQAVKREHKSIIPF